MHALHGSSGTGRASQILRSAAHAARPMSLRDSSDAFITCLEKAAADLQSIEHRLEAEFRDRYAQEARPAELCLHASLGSILFDNFSTGRGEGM